MASPAIRPVGSGGWRVARGAKQILPARLPPFPWPHLVPRRSRDTTENHESNLQGIPFRETVSRQTRFPQRAVSRFQIKDLEILHGRLTIWQRRKPFVYV